LENEVVNGLVQLIEVNQEAAAIIILLSLALGKIAKELSAVPNWAIPLVNAGLGIAGGVLFISKDPKGAAVGLILAVFSTGLHSFFKNGVLRKTGAEENGDG
jgi:hypothetical protein